MLARQAHTRFLMLQEEDRREGGLPTFAKLDEVAARQLGKNLFL
jgi:hypothetical protein